MAEESTARKIALREFKPESYKVWETSTKATLKFHKLFDIVDHSKLDPTPRDDDGSVLLPILTAVREQVEKWKHDHEQCSELDRPHYFRSCPTTDGDFGDPLGPEHRN